MLSTGEIDEEADQEDFPSQDEAIDKKDSRYHDYSTPNKAKYNTKNQADAISPRTQELYDSSLIKSNHFQQNKQTTHQMARANKSSRQLASNRQNRLIDNIVGNSKTMKRAKLILILKKFNITYADDIEDEFEGPRPVFWKICDFCRIDTQNQNEGEGEEEEEEEEIYDAEKLKELLKKAANGGKVTGIAAQIKPSVSSAISNMPIDIFTLRSRNPNENNNEHSSSPMTPTKHQRKKKRSSPKLTINTSPNRSSPISPTKSNQAQKSDIDNDLNDTKQNPKSKKQVTGSKYLPSFYDNLDMNRSPM